MFSSAQASLHYVSVAAPVPPAPTRSHFAVINKISLYCQMAPEGLNRPHLRTAALHMSSHVNLMSVLGGTSFLIISTLQVNSQRLSELSNLPTVSK